MEISNKEMLIEIKKLAEQRLVIDAKATPKDLFLALMILKSEIKIDNNQPTAYVYLNKNGRAVICINYDFWLKVDDKFSILVHEIFHPMHEHFTRFEYPKGNQKKAAILNIALDCSINQHIPYLNDTDEVAGIKHINFKSFCELYAKNGGTEEVLPFKNAEYYYDLLLSLPPQKGDGSDEGESGEGEQWADHAEHFEKNGKGDGKSNGKGQGQNGDGLTDTERELAKELFKEMAKRTMNRSGCSMTEIGFEEIGHKINWKSVLRRFIQNSTSNVSKDVRNRKNKKYGWQIPKRSYEEECHINLVADITGSMSSYLEEILKEIMSLAKVYKVKFGFYTIDTELKFIKTIDKPSDTNEVVFNSGGATDFNELVDLEKKGRKVPVVFMTDCYGEFPNRKLSFPMLILNTEKDVAKYVPEWYQRSVVSIAGIFEK